MQSIEDRLQQVSDRINQATIKYGRKAGSIRLLGVSKKQSSDKIAAAFDAGLRDFGENYLQEALEKQQNIAHNDINWHFIGPIQSNKCRAIAEHFSWVHSVDRLKVAHKLNQHRAGNQPQKLNILLQINIDEEESKSGFKLSELTAAASEINRLEHLRLRGLMAIPKARIEQNDQRLPFQKTRLAMQELNQALGLQMDTLSMGMSNDLEAAIAEGATIVRIGTALFGERTQETQS